MGKYYVEGVDWQYFDKYTATIDMYMPPQGEGDTQASQIVTAVNKLIYKWYNDGDVYDNVHSPMTGWANDLSSYANWLYRVCDYATECGDILLRIEHCFNKADYEHLLKDLADCLLDDVEWLEAQNKQPKLGSIYNCRGPFEFTDIEEDEEW